MLCAFYFAHYCCEWKLLARLLMWYLVFTEGISFMALHFICVTFITVLTVYSVTV